MNSSWFDPSATTPDTAITTVVYDGDDNCDM